MIYQLAAAL